ncbi:MAG: prepilin peptidase [Candidatus Izemoplasmatales bacterium]
MTVLYACFAFLSGALFASFAELVAARLDRGASIGGRSRCPACGTTLSLFDVFPLFGFALRGGRCRHCHAPIPIRHPIVETIGGALFVGAYLFYGFTWELAAAAIAIVVLLSATLSDLATKSVHDRVWLIGLIPLLAVRIADGSFLAHLLSAAVLFTLLYLFALIGTKVLKKEALGGGDVKLFVFIGFVLTWDEGILALFLAALAGVTFGLLRKRRGAELPFVPFLFAGVLVAQAVGADLIAWYLGLLGR